MSSPASKLPENLTLHMISFLITANRTNPKRSHRLRYVLRNKSTNQTYLVVLFTLYLKEDVNEDGSLKQAALDSHKPENKEVGEISEAAEEAEDPKAMEEARKKFEGLDVNNDTADTNDDVD